MTTVTTTPIEFMPCYNPIWVEASSTQTAQTNYKFIFEVFLEGSVTVDATFKVNAHPTTGIGSVDLHKYIESQVTSNILLTDTAIEQNADSIIKYDVKVGEEYDVAGVLTEFLAQNTISGKYGFNGSIGYNSFIDFFNGNFTFPLSAGTPVNFLTNSPTSLNIALAENAFMYAVIDTSNTLKWMHVTTKDSTGATNGEFRVVYDNATIPATTDQSVRLPVGTANLNTISAGDITTVSGATPIIDSDVATYEIYAEDSANAPSSNTYTFTIVDRSCKYTAYRVHFLNERGGFDSFTFDMISHKKWNKTSEEYKREGADFSSGTVTYSKSRHQKRPYFSMDSETLTLNSDWINEDESTWLRELFDSPEIYIEIDSELVAVSRITEGDYEEKTSAADKVHNLTFNITYTWDNFRQRC